MFRKLRLAMLGQTAIAFQAAGGCLPETFPRDIAETLIVNRAVDAFAFILDQLFFRLGI